MMFVEFRDGCRTDEIDERPPALPVGAAFEAFHLRGRPTSCPSRYLIRVILNGPQKTRPNAWECAKSTAGRMLPDRQNT